MSPGHGAAGSGGSPGPKLEACAGGRTLSSAFLQQLDPIGEEKTKHMKLRAEVRRITQYNAVSEDMVIRPSYRALK